MNRALGYFGLFLIIAALLLAAGCTSQPAEPAQTTSQPPPGSPVSSASGKDIVKTATDDGRFSTLVSAIQAANLTSTLSGQGPYTVFAPTDEAFKKLPAGTIESLLKEPDSMLAQILLFHVVPGKLMAKDFSSGKEIETLQGYPLKVMIDNSTFSVDGAMIVITDIETRNGVIHVIDTVLIPPGGCFETATTSNETSPHIHRWCEGMEKTMPFCTLKETCHTHQIDESANLALAAGEGPHTHALR